MVIYFFLFFLCLGIFAQDSCEPISMPSICPVSVAPIKSRTAHFNSHENLGMQLLAASKEFNNQRFTTLLRTIENQYYNDKHGFIRILSTKDEDGHNVLTRGAMIGDLYNLYKLFEAIKRVLGGSPELVYELLKEKSTEEENNVLGAGVYSSDRRVVNLILTYAIELLGQNKDLFFLFINSGGSKEGWKPLVNASDNSSSELIQMMIFAAQRVLGKNSELYHKFINAQDQEGWRAIMVAQNYEDILFLLNNGAEEEKIDPKEDYKSRRAFAMGKRLIAASNRADFKAFKLILHEGIEEFKEEEKWLFDFFFTRDAAGWNVLIHAAADGQYEYIQLVLEAIENHFSDKLLKSILIGNGDFEGRTALHLAIARRNFNIGHVIIRKFFEYSANNPLTCSFINRPDEISGFTPFMFLVYNTGPYDNESFAFLKHMLKDLANVFGKDSRIFGKIINSRDYNGWNVLAYASGSNAENLLRSYGAIDVPKDPIPVLSKFFENFVVGDSIEYAIQPVTPREIFGKKNFSGV